MVAVTIRDVPEDVRAELAARAARSGRSLQEFLMAHLTDLASRPSPDEVISRARVRLAATGGAVTADDIVEAVAAERR